MTVAFGLFHGLVLFPVILSVLGPVDKPTTSAASIPTISYASDVSTSASSSHAGSPGKGKKNRAFDPEVRDSKYKVASYKLITFQIENKNNKLEKPWVTINKNEKS